MEKINQLASAPPRRVIDASRSAEVEKQTMDVKNQLKEVLKRNGMYVGSSRAASILRELADEWGD